MSARAMGRLWRTTPTRPPVRQSGSCSLSRVVVSSCRRVVVRVYSIPQTAECAAARKWPACNRQSVQKQYSPSGQSCSCRQNVVSKQLPLSRPQPHIPRQTIACRTPACGCFGRLQAHPFAMFPHVCPATLQYVHRLLPRVLARARGDLVCSASVAAPRRRLVEGEHGHCCQVLSEGSNLSPCVCGTMAHRPRRLKSSRPAASGRVRSVQDADVHTPPTHTPARDDASGEVYVCTGLHLREAGAGSLHTTD